MERLGLLWDYATCGFFYTLPLPPALCHADWIHVVLLLQSSGLFIDSHSSGRSSRVQCSDLDRHVVRHFGNQIMRLPAEVEELIGDVLITVKCRYNGGGGRSLCGQCLNKWLRRSMLLLSTRSWYGRRCLGCVVQRVACASGVRVSRVDGTILGSVTL